MGIIIIGAFIVYVAITLAVLFIAIKLSPKRKWKWASALFVIVTSVLIPTWDIPIGRINFDRLCEDKAGQFIYKQIELGDEYFLKPGERDLRYKNERNPNAFAKSEKINLKKIEEDYIIYTDYGLKDNYSRWGYIRKHETTISAKDDQVVLSRAISFYYGSGWLLRYFSGGGGNFEVCPEEGMLGRNRPYTIHSNLPNNTFVKTLNKGNTR